MLDWLLLSAIIELGVITIAALVVLDRNVKQQQSPNEIPLMLPIEEIMAMRKDPRLNKPENGEGNAAGGQYL